MVILLCGASLASDKHKWERKTAYGTGIYAGADFVRYHNTCIYFSRAFVAGEFFNGLKIAEYPSGERTFEKNGVFFREFPDELVVYLRAYLSPCTGDRIVVDPDFGYGLMKGAAFNIIWKGGDQPLPLEIRSVKEIYLRPFRWDYYLTISGKGVPLKDALMLEVSLRGGIVRESMLCFLQPQNK
jgi:hypothetical protein